MRTIGFRLTISMIAVCAFFGIGQRAQAFNILVNPDAETGDLSGWSGGLLWANAGYAYEGSHAFGSSHVFTPLYQTVDLVDRGYGAEYLDTAPAIDAGVWLTEFHFGSKPPDDAYQVEVILEDIDHNILDQFDTGMQTVSGTWRLVSTTLSGYGTGLRYITFRLSGSDGGRGWAGEYGTHFDNAYVNMIDDTDPPTLTLSGSATMRVKFGAAFSDPGATAHDDLAGDITSDISVAGSVDTNVPGTYTLTYSVEDGFGNAASDVVRTVIVEKSGSSVDPSVFMPNPQTLGGAPEFIVRVNGKNTSEIMVPASEPVVLEFNADPSTVSGYAIADNPEFDNAVLKPYVSSVQFVRNPDLTTETFYIRFYAPGGKYTNTITRTIVSGVASGATAPASVQTERATAFTKDLKMGMRNESVRGLQTYLNTHGFLVAESGYGSKGNETTYFGAATMRALMKFQEANAEKILKPLGLSRGTGFFYRATREFINSTP